MRNIVRTFRTLALISPLLLPGVARANPGGGTVVAGTVDPLPAAGVNFDIGIHSQRAIIDWQSFSIQLGETTRFNFDGASGAVLNRVTTIDPANLSVIAGRLESNGQVILLNPNGILVTPTGLIDTRGFLGTTLALDPAAFMGGGGRFTFEGSADGSIVNQGVILARAKEGLPGGDVVLIAQTVRNDGQLSASEGLVGLAAGTKVTLYDTGDQRLVVETSAPDAEVVNGPEGVIAAVTAELKAAGGNIGALAINNQGVIRANTIVESGGRVFLRASRGTVVNSGTIEAAGSAPGTSGGRVEITGDQVLLASGSSINANGPAGGGTVLVGGDYQGANPEVQNALRTVVAPDATISASATGSGNGGKVIIWADEVTRFYGAIEALGGPLAGNGGFVETSGKDHLEAVGSVNASAPNGLGGTWLLDPRNVTIDNAASTVPADFSGASPNVFTPSVDSAVADRNTIQTSLNGGTSVQITTGATGAQAGNITVAATGSITKSAGGNATLTLDAANNIVVNAPISSSVGQLGITLNAIAGSVTVNSDLTSNGGAVNLTGATGINLNANVNAGAGAVDLNNAVVLGANTVTITGVGITFDSTINADDAANQNRTLVVQGGAGAVTFSGNVGASQALADLDVTGATINLNAGTVQVDDQGGNTATFTGAVVLGANVTVDTDGTTDNNVNFTSTINADNAATQNRTLAVTAGTGTATFGGAVGATQSLADLDVTAATINVNGATVQVDDDFDDGAGNTVTLTGAVVLGANVAVDTDGVTDNAVNFTSTVARDGTARDLTISAGGGAVTLGGNVGTGANLLGALAVNSQGLTSIDGTVNAASLTTDAGGTVAINTVGITTSGAQSYGENVALGANAVLTGTTPTFGGTVTGGGNDLTLNFSGATTIDGAVITGVKNLASGNGGATTLQGTLATTGTQTYSDNVTLGAATTLASTGVGAAGNISLSGTVNGAQTLAVNTAGTTTFGGAVGGGTALTSVTTDAGGTVAINGGVVTTTVVQTYNENVTLGANAVLTGSTPTFGGTVAGGGNDLALNFSGATTINGAVITGVKNLASGNGGATTLQGAITTTGTQTYTDDVTLGAATTLASSGAAAAGNISLNGTVNGGQTLVVNTAGTTTFGGAVGGTTPLTSVTTDDGTGADGTALNGGTIATTGTQTFNDNVSLGAATTVSSSGVGAAGDIAFNGTVNGAQTLAVNTAGTTSFDQLVGGTTPLTSLTTDAGGTVGLNSSITTSGVQSYGENVVLGGTVVLTGTTPTFGGTVAGGGNDLTLNFSGATTIDGAVITGVDALVSGNGGTTTLQGIITTTGGQTYNDDIVTPAGATTLAAATTVTFNGGLSPGGDAGVGTLNVNANLSFGATANLFVTLNGTTAGQFDQIDVNGGDVTIANDQATLAGSAGVAFSVGNNLQIITKDVGSSRSGNFAPAASDNVTIDGQAFNIQYGGGPSAAAVTLARDLTLWLWDGGGGDDDWSTVQNWQGNQFNPSSGDSIAFAGNNGTSPNNDNFAGLVLNQILFNNGASAFTVSGFGVTLQSGVVNNSAAIQTINLPINMAANLTMNAAAGQVRFGALGTINGGFDLTLSGGSLVTLGAAVGGTTPLTQVSATAPVAINGGVVTTSGAQTYSGTVSLGAGTTLNGTTPTFGGVVTGNNNDLTLNFSGATTIDGAVITGVNDLASGNGGTTTVQGNVTTTGTQTFSENVTVGANAVLTGTTPTFGGTVVGGGNDLALNFSGATTIDGAVITGVKNLASGNGGTTTLLGTINTTGTQTYGDDVVLADNVTVASSGAGANANIAFNGAVNADDATVNDRSLTVNAGPGTATFGGNVGTGTSGALADLNVTAATINLNGATVQVDDQGGNTVDLNGAVVLGANVAIDTDGTTDNSVNFAGTVNRDGTARALTVNAGAGNVTLTANVGAGGNGALGAVTLNSQGLTSIDGTLAAASLATDAGGTVAINTTAITTTGAQNYGDDIALGANAVLTGTTLTFGPTVTGGGNDLTLNFSGATTIDGAVVTGVKNLASGNGGTTTLQGTITTTGTQTYSDNVDLGIAPTLVSSGVGSAGDISFTGTVNGAQDLVVNTAGTTTFGGAVGGGTALTSLTTDNAVGADGTVLGANVTTTGAQNFNDDVSLSANVTLAGTTANFGTTLAGANNDLTLNLTGATTIDGAVITGVNDLASGGGGTTTLQGNISTTGTQTYDDVVALAAATALDGTAVAINGNLAGANNSLAITGATTLGDAAADALSGLSTLVVNGNTTVNAGSVASSGNQDFNGNLTLAGGGAKNLTASQVAVDGNLIGGNSALTITGNAVLGDAQADTVAGLASLDVTGATLLNAGSVNTGTGDQGYAGNLTLAGGAKTLTGGTASFGGAVIGGGNDLTLTFSGATTLDGAAVTGVDDLVSNGGGTTTLQGNIATTGTQTYTDNVTLGGATTVASTGVGAAGNIAFNGTVNGAADLAVNTAGVTTFATQVGNATPLNSLTTDAPGSVALNGGTITTAGAQTYNDAATLGVATTVASTGGGNISFNGTLNGAQTLAVNTAGITGFGGAVGGVTPLTTLTTDALGSVSLTGGSLITSGAQTYNDQVVLGADTAFQASTLLFNGGLNPNGFAVGTITVGDQIFANPYVLSADTFLVSTAGKIEFISTVNSDGTARSLTLNSPGDTIFGGAVGAISPLRTLTTDAPGRTLINGGQITAVQTINLQDPVVLGADTTVAATTVTFANTVNAATAGVQGLVVNAAGVTTFGGVVGGTAALEALATDDAAGADTTVLAANVTTTTSQTYGDDVTAAGNLTGVGITIGGNATLNGVGNQTVSAGTGALTTGGTMTKTSAGNLALDGDGGVSVTGNLAVNGGSLNVNDALTAGSVAASQNVSLVSVNTAGGVTATAGSLAVTGATTAGGNVGAGTSVNLGGIANVGGNVSAGTTAQFGTVSDVNGSVSAGGAATFAGPSNIGGNVSGTGVTFNNTAVLDGGADQTVNAGTGALTANSTLTKTGTGSLTLDGDAGVNVTGNLAVSPAGGSLTVQDNLVAGGTVLAAQNVTLANATITGDLLATSGNVLVGNVSASSVTAGGNVNVANAVTLSGNLTAGGLASIGGAADVNGNVTAGGLLTFGGHATLAGNVSGAGVTFNNSATLDGAASQSVVAGTGALTANTTVTKTGAGDLTLSGAGGVNVTGNLAVNTAGGSLNVTDTLTAGGAVTAPQNATLANATITGALLATSGNVLGGNVSASTVVAGGNVTLAGVSAGSVNAGGDLNVAGNSTVAGGVNAANSISLGGASTLGANVTAGNGITFGGAATLNGVGAQTINAGTGTLLASAALNKADTGGLNLVANEVDFGGGAGSVNGDGVLSIQTSNAAGKIGLGNLTIGNAPDRLDLSAADTAAIGAGFDNVLIGDLASTREILIGSGATFASPLTLRVDALSAANIAIGEELTGSLQAGRLSLTAIGQVLLGNAGLGSVPDPLQPANQIASLGDVTVTGNFYLYDSGAPVDYLPGEEGPAGTSPFFLDQNVNNQRGLELAGDFTQLGSGVQTVIRTTGDLNLLPGTALQTGVNNVTVLSAEVPIGSGALANFHNAGATDANGAVVLNSTDGITVGSGSQLLVFSSDANFSTFQRGGSFNVNSSAQNGVQPIGGQFHFGRIVTTPPSVLPFPGNPQNFQAIFGQTIAANVFTFASGLGDVQFVIRSADVPVPPEASKFVFFDFAPEPFAGITLDTQSFRLGLARPGTEIRTHSSLLYDFEEWNKKNKKGRQTGVVVEPTAVENVK